MFHPVLSSMIHYPDHCYIHANHFLFSHQTNLSKLLFVSWLIREFLFLELDLHCYEDLKARKRKQSLIKFSCAIFYFIVRIYSTMASASSLLKFGCPAIGISPHTPCPPAITFPASFDMFSALLSYFFATSV